MMSWQGLVIFCVGMSTSFVSTELISCGNIDKRAATCVTETKQTFEESQKKCKSMGDGWSLLLDTTHVTQRVHHTVWLPWRRNVLPAWSAVPNREVAADIRINGNSSGKCTAIEVLDGDKLGIVSCNDLRFPRGYLCEFNEKVPWFWRDQCIHIASSRVLCVGYNSNIQSWTAARAWCIRHGGDLAVPRSPAEIRTVVKFINENNKNLFIVNGHSRSVGTFFTGITKEQWSAAGRANNLIQPGNIFWTPGQPAEGSCTILTKDGWNTTSCLSEHAAICQLNTTGLSEEYIAEHSIESKTDGTSTSNYLVTVLIIVSVVLGVLMLFFLLLSVLVCLKPCKICQKRSSQENKRTAEKTELLQESSPAPIEHIKKGDSATHTTITKI